VIRRYGEFTLLRDRSLFDPRRVQREDVLLKALRVKSGVRAVTSVASMGDVVYALNDDDMKALAYFMATRP
jgi:cytochrome c553